MMYTIPKQIPVPKREKAIAIVGWKEAICENGEVYFWYIENGKVKWKYLCSTFGPVTRKRNTRFTDWEKSLQ